MMEVPEHIELLIASFLNNEANAEEIQALQEWRALSPENEQYFLDLEFVHQISSSVTQHFEVNVDEAWKKVEAEVKAEVEAEVEVEDKPKQFFLFGSGMLRAVVLTLLAGLSFIAYWYSQKSDANFELVADAEVIQTHLPDQTAVVLEKGARITAMENQNERAYTLQGEAYFEIHKDSKPFVLYTDELRIRDIGTAFRVKAPESNDTIWVEVKEGIVQLEKEGNTTLEISAGESAYYLKSAGSFHKKEVAILEKQKASFRFIETKLGVVVAQLNEQFGTTITLANPALEECEITVEFKHEPLIPILEIITLTLNLDYEETSEGYRILGTACTVD